ncbi:polymer biosynthesis protein, WecB/TagA/CpsF family [Microbulbifer donghaiensis]|uniref:Polymer biosynthesis protein, WecB/TagA/CpsF family n=1 Tax=Microbulbifer donghaiensis TaxID=494016 RepID=A0A1M4ZZ48_9GAMM|nr:WecB/TagA/CpsF family glycosyltransferase [Microbulbifer donghaiensis]SHF23333.1 polymer biosynthesis protein, WecB/TagA/CpsF family [Microbulbifer donghaiensis]
MKTLYGTQEQPQRIDLPLCPFDAVKMDEAIREIQSLAKSKQYHYVITPNIDHLQRLYLSSDDSSLREIYRQSSLSLCDSRVLKLLMPVIGVSVPEAVPGSTLTCRLFDQLLGPADRILIIGGDRKVIEALREQYCDLDISHINPSMGFIKKPQEVEEIVRATCALNPDYIFIAVGSPQQELLAHRIGTAPCRGVALCVGASLLFMTGQEKRAPDWMQTISCEWLYRMISNPRRLVRRYILNLIYLPGIVNTLRQHGPHTRKIKANG